MINWIIGNRVKVLISALLFLAFSEIKAQNIISNQVESIKKGELLFADNFDSGLSNWVTEIEDKGISSVKIKNAKMAIDVTGGATVWFNKKLLGNYLIEFKRTVLMKEGNNDRLSDFNQFWMALDPKNENLFTRSGKFSEYDSLSLYYVGMGGNSNSTTRFRKYTGDGERILYAQINDENHLLKPNHTYQIQIIVKDGTTQFIVDGELCFSFYDECPLKEGYFGFRTVHSHQLIDDFKIYNLNNE